MKKLIQFILLPLFLAGLFITVAFLMPAHDSPPPSGWYQQFMPNLNNQPLNDVTFVDSLNGWAVTNINTPTDSGYVLKTTNGGDNWTIKFKNRTAFKKVVFLNINTGFTFGNMGGTGNCVFYKSTNGGENWFLLNVPSVPMDDMFVLNEDTIWFTDSGGFDGGIFCTTNGGLNWITQYYYLGNNPKKIYMYNRNIGFACTDFELFKTTNSGTNWIQISGTAQSNRFFDMYFIDSLTGWKSNDTMQKTTNGGLNWINQQVPRGPNISYGIYSFSNVNIDTIWGAGGVFEYPNLQDRGILYRTTNGGDNWYYQIPDTSFRFYFYGNISFINKLIGWAYGNLNGSGSGGIHTVNGGDTVWYIGIVQQSKTVPLNFELKQNYPNPFNPRTVIPYSLKSAGYVRIIAYDILGREVQRLVDQKQSAGEYEVDFMGKFCSSGVYFYSMTVDGKVIDTKKMLMLK
jgi:photosystem II stability/assembly factor-like uncharacterized protein